MFQRSLRANFSRLRLSAHSLMIEKGRHFTKKIPVENRLCKLCNFNEIEDEFHFMIRCSYYNNPRDVMFADIYEVYGLKDLLSDDDKFLLLMGVTEYDCILPVIKYVNSAFELRKTYDI